MDVPTVNCKRHSIVCQCRAITFCYPLKRKQGQLGASSTLRFRRTCSRRAIETGRALGSNGDHYRTGTRCERSGLLRARSVEPTGSPAAPPEYYTVLNASVKIRIVCESLVS